MANLFLRDRRLYAGLFLLACSVLMLELTMVRLLSVSKGSHLALFTISMAMFGSSAGAIYVVLRPGEFAREGRAVLSRYCWWYSLAIVPCLFFQLWWPQVFASTPLGILSTLGFFAVGAVPFFLSGVCISLTLSGSPEGANRLYAADLIGAALGTWLTVLCLYIVSGETAGVIAAVLGSLAAAAYSRPVASPLLSAILLAGLAIFNQQHPVLSFVEPKFEWLGWTPTSRVTVEPGRGLRGWGLSDRFRGELPAQAWLEIDGTAGTPVVAYEGNPAKVEFLAWDVTALPFHLRPGGSTVIVGAGGGKDALTALLFGAREVHALELNSLIVKLLRTRLKSFSGDLVDKVDYQAVDGRIWLKRQTRRFDLIQLALVDNASGFARGAVPLSENALYTLQAWQSFVRRLNDSGVLAVSMGYYQERPAHLYRCLALGAATLKSLGIEPDSRHFLISRKPFAFKLFAEQPDGVFTLMLSRRPFSAQDLKLFQTRQAELGFDTLLPEAQPTLLSSLAAGEMPSDLPYDIRPPEDTRPYFFFTALPRELLVSSEPAVRVIRQELFTCLVLAALSFAVPYLATRHLGRPTQGVFPAYFFCLGLAYMLVEFAFAQSLTVYLGHSGWSFAVLLSGMLFFSGLGSACSGLFVRRAPLQLWFGVLLLVLAFTGLGLSWLGTAFADLHWRIIRCLLVLAPGAFLMGFPFPIGLNRAASSSQHPLRLAWCWALNGAGAVLAAPLAMLLALLFGNQAVLGLGMLAYAVACLLAPSGD